MWFWRPKRNSKCIFLGELFCLSLFFHVLLLSVLFVLQGRHQDTIKIQVNAQGKIVHPVLFLPKNRNASLSGNGLFGAQSVRSGNNGHSEKKGSFVAPRPEKSVARSEWASATVDNRPASGKRATQAKSNRKKERTKKGREAAQKARMQKKVKKEKPPVVEKAPEPIKKPKPVPEPVIPAPVHHVPPTVPPQVPENGAAPDSLNAPTQEAGQALGDTPLVMMGADVSLESVIMQEAVQQEMSEHWHPPVGLSKDLCCHIKVSIAQDGSIEGIAVEQASGILAYDMSARSAVMHMKLPQWAWGKELVLIFKQ